MWREGNDLPPAPLPCPAEIGRVMLAAGEARVLLDPPLLSAAAAAEASVSSTRALVMAGEEGGREASSLSPRFLLPVILRDPLHRPCCLLCAGVEAMGLPKDQKERCIDADPT